MIFWFWLLTIASAHANDLLIPLHQSQRIKSPLREDVHVSNGQVIGVKDLGATLMITGLNPGASRLSVGKKVYFVWVGSDENLAAFSDLRRLIAQMKGLTSNFDGGTFTIDGEILRFSDWLKIATWARAYQVKYKFKARVDSAVGERLAEHLAAKLRKKNLSLPRLSFFPEVRAAVAARDPSIAAIYSEALAPYGIAVEKDPSLISSDPLVRLKVIIAEVNSSFARNFGFGWESTLAAQVLPSFSQGGQLLIGLKALETEGRGQILASPNLLCRSGAQAEFLAGGEFPIRIMNYYTKDVTWKKHGVLLQFKPTVDSMSRIHVELTTEVSLIDPAQTVDGVPGLKTNRIHSQFMVKSARTVALSGLLQKNLGNNQNGLPWLRQIPILGKLFSSDDYLKSKTELVVFVTPEIEVDDAPETKVQMPHEWQDDETEL